MLEADGATFDDVVKTVDYIVPAALPSYATTADIRRELFENNLPAATGVIVNRLLRPSMLIEVEVIAVLG
jgi:enamine deaminase RidA (YjgF/YER057c/UK114 family)